MEQPKSIYVDGTHYETGLTQKYRNRKPYQKANAKNLCAAIPGVVLEVMVKPGQQVKLGEGLISLEAMKMQNLLTSPGDGEILAIRVEKGQHVVKGEVLVELR
jgi:biotin carboxyl carrier protein